MHAGIFSHLPKHFSRLAFCPQFLFRLAVPSEGKEKYSPNALIILKTETIEEMQRAVEEIKTYGGHIDHIFPPKGLIGYLPPEASDYFAILPDVFAIEYHIADEKGLGQLGEGAGIAAHVWNTVFCGLPAAASTTVIKGVPQTPGKDALVAPDRELLWQDGEERILEERILNVPGFYETSEFFVGSVVVGIITPESNGTIDSNSENWDSARQSTVVAKITEGLQWWKD